MTKLRAPGGVRWIASRPMNPSSPYLIEENYELVEAIDNKDDVGIREELGDLLLQVVFHADKAKERGAFDFGDVIDAISAKMISRHPHVFAGAKSIRPKQYCSNGRPEKKNRVNSGSLLLTACPAPAVALAGPPASVACCPGRVRLERSR